MDAREKGERGMGKKGRVAQMYRATKGKEVIEGSIPYVANQIGVTQRYLQEMKYRKEPIKGWTVAQLNKWNLMKDGEIVDELYSLNDAIDYLFCNSIKGYRKWNDYTIVMKENRRYAIE